MAIYGPHCKITVTRFVANGNPVIRPAAQSPTVTRPFDITVRNSGSVFPVNVHFLTFLWKNRLDCCTEVQQSLTTVHRVCRTFRAHDFLPTVPRANELSVEIAKQSYCIIDFNNQCSFSKSAQSIVSIFFRSHRPISRHVRLKVLLQRRHSTPLDSESSRICVQSSTSVSRH